MQYGLHVIRVQHFTLAGPVARRAPPPHAKERSLLASSIANGLFKAFKTVYCMLSFLHVSFFRNITGIIFSDFHGRVYREIFCTRDGSQRDNFGESLEILSAVEPQSWVL